MIISDKLAEIARDYWNNYLTIEKFAEHNQLTPDQARTILAIGKEIHESRVEFYKAYPKLAPAK